jgi:hypothetical protein
MHTEFQTNKIKINTVLPWQHYLRSQISIRLYFKKIPLLSKHCYVSVGVHTCLILIPFMGLFLLFFSLYGHSPLPSLFAMMFFTVHGTTMYHRLKRTHMYKRPKCKDLTVDFNSVAPIFLA